MLSAAFRKALRLKNSVHIRFVHRLHRQDIADFSEFSSMTLPFLADWQTTVAGLL
jgi:hypothetical protein